MERFGDITPWRASKGNWMSISFRLWRMIQPASGRVNISSLVHPLVIEDYIERCPVISGLGPFNPITSLCPLHWPGRNRNGTVYTLWHLYWFPTTLWFLMMHCFTVSSWTNCCAVGGEDLPPPPQPSCVHLFLFWSPCYLKLSFFSHLCVFQISSLLLCVDLFTILYFDWLVVPFSLIFSLANPPGKRWNSYPIKIQNTEKVKIHYYNKLP